jgi:hypothetical protein
MSRDVVGRSRPHIATSVLHSSRDVLTNAEAECLSPSISALSSRQQLLTYAAQQCVAWNVTPLLIRHRRGERAPREKNDYNGKARRNEYKSSSSVTAVRSTPSPLETDTRLGDMFGASAADTAAYRRPATLQPPKSLTRKAGPTRLVCASPARIILHQSLPLRKSFFTKAGTSILCKYSL